MLTFFSSSCNFKINDHVISAMRGFMTSNGLPDCPRTSRYILKDYVKVSIYCIDPR